MAARNRRDRLVRFLIKFGPDNGVRIGRTWYDWTALTDDALQAVSEETVFEFWAQRRRAAASRKHYASLRAA